MGDAEVAQEIQRRAASVDPASSRGPSADPRSISPIQRPQPPSTGTVVLVPVRPASGPSGRLSARHREAIARAGAGTQQEQVKDLEPWPAQRPQEIEAGGPIIRDVLPPAAARMAEEVLNQEVEGLGECLNICAQRSRTLKLLGFQHLHYDARLQSILKSKAQNLGLALVSELLLLARGLFAFREAARHGFLWERLQGRERSLATTTRDASGLRLMHKKARIRVRNHMDRSLTLADRSLLQYCFADFVRHVQEEKLVRVSTSNSTLVEVSVIRRQKLMEALKRHFAEADQKAISWCFNAWVIALSAARSETTWQQQYAGMAARMMSNSGEALLAQCFSAWAMERTKARQAEKQRGTAAAALARQFSASNELLIVTCICGWKGDVQEARENKRRKSERMAQTLRLVASWDEATMALCFNAFITMMKDRRAQEAEEGLSATRKRYLAAYFRHFAASREVLQQSSFNAWSSAAKEQRQARRSSRRIAGLMHRCYCASNDVIMQQVMAAWEQEVDRAKKEWLIQVRQEQMQEELMVSRRASKSVAMKQAARILQVWVTKTTERVFTAWGGLCENVRTKKKKLTRDLALAQRTLANSDDVILVQAFRAWVVLAQREKHEGQVTLAQRREELTRVASKRAIHKQCTRSFMESERHLLDVYFVHWESIAEQVRINRRRLQQSLALAVRALTNSVDLLVHLVFTCWAQECELRTTDGKLKSATERLQQLRNISKHNAAKQCARTTITTEQLSIYTTFRSWLLALEWAKDIAERKGRDMARAVMVIVSMELTTISGVFHGWHRVAKSKHRAKMHCASRTSSAEEALLAYTFNSWGRAIDAERMEQLKGEVQASMTEAEQKIKRGQEKTTQALCRQFHSRDKMLLRTVFTSWRSASDAIILAYRRKHLSVSHECRRCDDLNKALKAQCFAAFASSAAAARAERAGDKFQSQIRDLTCALEEATLNQTRMAMEVERYRASVKQKQAITASRCCASSNAQQLTTVFHAWASVLSSVRRKELGFRVGRRLDERAEGFLLLEVLSAWIREAEHCKASFREQVLTKRLELHALAIGQGLQHHQHCMIEAFKWQFDDEDLGRAQTCFIEWKGCLDRRRRSITRREEFAARAARMLLASNEALLAVCFCSWQGVIKSFKRVKMALDKAMLSRSKLVDCVDRLADTMAKATRLSTFATWHVLVVADRQRLEQKERIMNRLHKAGASADSSLLRFSFDAWCRDIAAEKGERMAEANSRSGQKLALLKSKTMGALSKQFSRANDKVVADSFHNWRGFVSSVVKKAGQKCRMLERISCLNDSLLSLCFLSLIRNLHERHIEREGKARREAMEAVSLVQTISRKQHFEWLSARLSKSDESLLSLVLDKWSSCIASKKTKKEGCKALKMWIASSGQNFSSFAFHAWEREVERVRQYRRSKQQTKKFRVDMLNLQLRQFISLALREWRGWASSSAKERRLRKEYAARFMRSIAAANSKFLSGVTVSWLGVVQKEKSLREKREIVKEQAYIVVNETCQIVLSQCFDAWQKEASNAIRSELNEVSCQAEKAKARCMQQAKASRHKALVALGRQHTRAERQALFTTLSAWRTHVEHIVSKKLCKAQKVSQANATAASLRSARLAHCFYSWGKEVCDRKSEKQLAEARAQLQKASERLKEFNAMRSKRKDFPRHFVHTTKGTVSLCWSAWQRYVQNRKECQRQREENMARTVRSNTSADQSLLICTLGLWHSEAKYERQGRFLLEASERCRGLTTNMMRGAGEMHGRTVSILLRQLSMSKTRLGFWSFHCWHDGVLQATAQSKSKKDLKARCLERIGISMQATKFTYLILWSCAAARVVLERNLSDSTRHLEDRQAACATAERSRERYLEILLRQRAETATSLALACFSGWCRAAYAMRLSSRKKAWAHVVAEHAIAVAKRGLLEQCIAIWSFFREKARHERRIEHFMQDMSDRATSEVEVANQRVRVAGACVDEARKAQAHTKGRTKERALSVAMRSVALMERSLRAKFFLCWCSTTLAARMRKAGEQRCKELRGDILRRARLAAGFSRRWLDAVLLAQCIAVWRLCSCLGLQLRQQQKIQRGSFTKACANIVKLRLRLHEQKYLYQWVQICPFKTKEPPSLFRFKGPDFAQEPPSLYSRPASAREPRWSITEREPEPAPSPAPSPAPCIRPASAVEGRRQQALPADESWKPWTEAKTLSTNGSAQNLVGGKLALTNQGGVDSQKELVQLLQAERACAEGAAAAANATAALAMASATNAGPQRPSSAIGPGDRYNLARHAMVSEVEYRRLLEQNRREIRDSRAERENEHAPRFVGWGVWRP